MANVIKCQVKSVKCGIILRLSLQHKSKLILYLIETLTINVDFKKQIRYIRKNNINRLVLKIIYLDHIWKSKFYRIVWKLKNKNLELLTNIWLKIILLIFTKWGRSGNRSFKIIFSDHIELLISRSIILYLM